MLMESEFAYKFRYGNLSIWTSLLGVFLVCLPTDRYGPAWSYFHEQKELILPAGGQGMGVCLIIIGLLQTYAVFSLSHKMLWIMLFFSGFIFWVSGILLLVEGILSGDSAVSACFMLFIAIHKFVLSAAIQHAYKHHIIDWPPPIGKEHDHG
jgi:hypothetical protein